MMYKKRINKYGGVFLGEIFRGGVLLYKEKINICIFILNIHTGLHSYYTYKFSSQSMGQPDKRKAAGDARFLG